MENYHKVMGPFLKNIQRLRNKPPAIVQNPYAKTHVVKYYELLSKNLLTLKSAMTAMNNDFFNLTE